MSRTDQFNEFACCDFHPIWPNAHPRPRSINNKFLNILNTIEYAVTRDGIVKNPSLDISRRSEFALIFAHS